MREAHTWSNRPIWPQGHNRPAGNSPLPDKFDWNLWLGVAPERPYVADAYHPFKWRGWYDFGAGALGDMGCHIIDPVVWSLELGPPSSVAYSGPQPNKETFPTQETLLYKFPATQHTAGPLPMTWYDGGRLPSAAQPHLPPGLELPNQGILLVGEKATLLCSHGGSPQLYAEKEKIPFAYTRTGPNDDHYMRWLLGISTGSEPNSSFAYAGPLTETVLLGVIASRIGEGELQWDAESLRFPNSEAATGFVRQEYRQGWEVEGLS